MHIVLIDMTQRGATLFRNIVANATFLTLAGFAIPLKSRLL
jgi:hypothetical protein